ncbi:S-layer homology domain-containing protein [Anoxybacillus flavithermus]|uniref:S-layer-like domain-containing protein n=1 Tax=Anoxybacillus flavithermus (strain DSM 21510 / WK1) TaxID=491915 RepID=B7GL20_ANOFW|nr:S-layer homology domain-containing protein [Anoxybacillus flavithermus]ACJ34957.1 S-layer-like domain-containing protein [Anoxybacillus flavithermus WK1]
MVRKWIFPIVFVCGLFLTACEQEHAGASEEQEIATAPWTEQQIADTNSRLNQIDEKMKQLEQQLTKMKTAAESPQVFKDVPLGHWAYVSVARLYRQNIVGGVGDGLFAPNQAITRAQAAAMLVRAFQLPLSNKPSIFADVPNSHPFAREIMTAYEAGFVGGYPNNRFAPQESMKRKHMAMIIQRAFRLQATSAPYAGYKDVTNETEGALEIRIISQHGIAEGSNGYFYPEQPTTRAHFATFMDRALQNK